MAPPAELLATAGGRYVYCLVPPPVEPGLDLGRIGLDGSPVYAAECGAFAALVHACPGAPYREASEEQASRWVLAHHRVVETAWERWDAVLPMTFNTIVVGAPEESPEERLRGWVEARRELLRARLEALRGRAEYGLQVFLDTAEPERAGADPGPEAPPLPEPGDSMPRGLAYMQRRKLDRERRRQGEAAARELLRSVYERVDGCAERVRVESTGEARTGMRMVVNLSCLITRADGRALEAIVQELASREGHDARLVGPLPPYSFT